MQRLLFCLVLCLNSAPAWAAEKWVLVESFLGAVEQVEQFSTQHDQASLVQLSDACRKHKEGPCNAIIASAGMPPAAYFIAFAVTFELELGKGDTKAARKNYDQALHWAEKMPKNEDIVRDWRQQEGRLNAAVAHRSKPPSSPRSKDVVCHAAAVEDWHRACLKAREDVKGARLYRSLSDVLISLGTTLDQILECDSLMQEQERAGLACFQSKGVTEDLVPKLQIAALEFELVVESYIVD